MSAPGTEHTTVGIELADAAELAELCGYLVEWIAGASPVVHESLRSFGGAGAPECVTEALRRFAALLVRRAAGAPR
jgi:hypothetical protein